MILTGQERKDSFPERMIMRNYFCQGITSVTQTQIMKGKQSGQPPIPKGRVLFLSFAGKGMGNQTGHFKSIKVRRCQGKDQGECVGGHKQSCMCVCVCVCVYTCCQYNTVVVLARSSRDCAHLVLQTTKSACLHIGHCYPAAM